MSKHTDYKTGRGERLSYGLYALGAILSYYFIMSYLQIFMTDIGISAVTVGIIFMAAKAWDAINDPIFGVLVDKVNFKRGKYKPWLKIASIAIPISTILLFVIPSDVSIQIKIIWSSIAYLLWDTSYTMYDVPMNAIVTSMTDSQKERNKLYSFSAFFVYLGALLVAIVVPMMFPNIGWGPTSIILGVICFGFMLPLNFKVKERYNTEEQEEITVTQILLSLVKNKYLLIFTFASIIGSVFNFAIPLNGYFAIHNLGDAKLMTPLTLASAIPVLFIVLFVPKILEKIDKFKVYIGTRIITILVDVIIFVVGYKNVGLLFALIFVKNIFAGVWGVTAIMFIADCVEYGHYTFGERVQGIAFSTKAFTNKIIVALTSALAMFGLAAFGFVEGTNVMQTQATVDGIWLLYACVPIIGSVLSVIVMLLFYKLRDKDVQTMTRCNNGEITKEEANTLFMTKF